MKKKSVTNNPDNKHPASGGKTVHLSIVCLSIIATVANGHAAKQEPLTLGQALGQAGFRVTNENHSNASFRNELRVSSGAENQVLLNGSGVSAGDYNQDGLPDLYFCGLESENVLYENKGQLRFEPVQNSELACKNIASTSSAFADLDGDGDLDLVVGTVGKGLIAFINEKNGVFTRREIALPNATSLAVYSTPMTDLDRDGDLDIYVATYRSTSIRNSPNLKFELGYSDNQQTLESAIDTKTGERFSKDRFYISDGKVLEAGTEDYLLINDGSGRFEAVTLSKLESDSNGKTMPIKQNWGLGAIFADFNNDHWDDIYVCNDLDGADYFYHTTNLGFVDAIPALNRITPAFSMGVDVADLNNDGRSDFIVVDMLNSSLSGRKMQIPHETPKPNSKQSKALEYRRNMLYVGAGDGGFNEIAHHSGLESTDWSWCPMFLDVDLDGYQDVLVTNGFSYDLENPDVQQDLAKQSINDGGRGSLIERSFKLKHSKLDTNKSYRNRGDLTFEDVSTNWKFNLKGISHGACLADLDKDGDLDVVVNNFSLYLPERELLGKRLPKLHQSDPICSIYENLAGPDRIKVRVRLSTGNTHGIGATIVFTQGSSKQTSQIRTGSRYCSSDNPEVAFAWLPGKSMRRIECHLDGKRAVLDGIKANTLITLNDSDFIDWQQKDATTHAVLFAEQALGQAFRHKPSQLNAQHFQPTVSRNHYPVEPVISAVAASGEAVNVIRVNQGGIVLPVVLNDNPIIRRRQSGYSRWDIVDFAHLPIGKKMMRLELQRQLNSQQEFVSRLSIMDDATNARSSSWHHPLPGNYNCLAITQFPTSPDEILIALGGGAALGHYPLAAKSLVLALRLAKPNSPPRITHKLPGTNPVNDLVFSDMDGQVGQELIIAPDGGEITIFRLGDGNITNITQALGLGSGVGNWNSLACGDFSGNGKNDLFAANWGSNHPLNRYTKKDYRVYYRKENEVTHLYESFHVNGENVLKPSLAKFKASNPIRGMMYKSHEAFRMETIEGIFQAPPNYRSIKELRTRLFLSNDSKFKAHPLPVEVQFAPTFGIAVEDFDLDGSLDIALAQGFVDYYDGTEPQSNQSNLILINRLATSGSFEILQKSGLAANRAFPRIMASGDFNDDNLPDLITPEYNGKLRCFINQSSNKGMKLILQGDGQNRIGIKARLRYKDGSRGPIYEYISKYGYRKEAANSFIFGMSKSVEAIEILDGSKLHTLDVEPDKATYTWN